MWYNVQKFDLNDEIMYIMVLLLNLPHLRGFKLWQL